MHERILELAQSWGVEAKELAGWVMSVKSLLRYGYAAQDEARKALATMFSGRSEYQDWWHTSTLLGLAENINYADLRTEPARVLETCQPTAVFSHELSGADKLRLTRCFSGPVEGASYPASWVEFL